MDQIYETISSKKDALQKFSCKICDANISQRSQDFLQIVDEKIESNI